MDRLHPAVMYRASPAAFPRRRPPNVFTSFSVPGLVLAALIVGCGEGHAAASDSARADSIARARQDSINRAQPGYIVDSILPVAEQLRRFRVGLDTVREFKHGVASAERLVREVVSSVARTDTAALVRLTVSRAEFAWLLYPDSPLAAPPYRQSPDIVWLQQSLSNGTGLNRLLARLGGRPITLENWRCAATPRVEGANKIWGDCSVRFSEGGAQTNLRLFASIIERQGRFKILSFANAF